MEEQTSVAYHGMQAELKMVNRYNLALDITFDHMKRKKLPHYSVLNTVYPIGYIVETCRLSDMTCL